MDWHINFEDRRGGYKVQLFPRIYITFISVNLFPRVATCVTSSVDLNERLRKKLLLIRFKKLEVM